MVHYAPLLASRFECKYLIPPSMVGGIRKFMQPFVELDPHSAACESTGYAYGICSLYLDSPDLLLYRQTAAGEKRRFKLRIRSYCDTASHPVFLEVKKRENAVLQKTRAEVSRESAAALLAGRSSGAEAGLSGETARSADDFVFYVKEASAEPVVRVKYRREAWIATGGEPTRITFDTELMHAVTLDSTLLFESGSWVRTPIEGTILEIKFTDRYPFWVESLVQEFELRQRSIPKYGMSVEHMMRDERASTLTMAGFTLPPQRQTSRAPLAGLPGGPFWEV